MPEPIKMETTPAGVIRPTEAPWENQRFPSGPAAIPYGRVYMAGSAKFETTPVGVIRPIELLPALVNHKFPSDPVAIPNG